MAEEKKGVWRTVRGRRIFIPEGQDLYTAMVNSGKFKELKRGEYQKAKAEVDFKTKRDEYEQDTGRLYGRTAKEAQQLEQKWLKDANNATNEKDRDFALAQMRAWKKNFEETKAHNKQQMKDADFRNQLYSKYYDEPIETYSTTGLDGKHMTPKERAKAIDNANNWREQIKANNEARDKKAEEILSKRNSAEYRYHPDKFDDDYYGTYRETEKLNAGIKQEVPNEEYEFVESYGTYHEKKNRLAGQMESWTGKEYTNDEFMEHLEDANWHTERRMLLDAKLTNAQLGYIKDNTRLSDFSAELDKAKTQSLIGEAKTKFPARKASSDKEIEDSIHSLFVYKNEKGMGSGQADPLKRYNDIYGKENVDRVWKQMEDKYEVIEGTSMDSEGLRYNNLIEKSKYSPEAIQAYKNRMNTIYEQFGTNSREYNAAAKVAADEFERAPKTSTAKQMDYDAEVEKYYRTISVDNISADLDERKYRMEQNLYAPNDKETYQKWNEATEKYLGQRLSQESERLRNSTPKQKAEAIDNANKETFTKSGKINYKAFGIESNPEDSFSDDGNRFTMYRLPNGLQMSVHRYDGDIYMSVRSPYEKGIEYKELSQLPHYRDLDMYNGVREGSVDLNKLIKASDDFLGEYNELLKSKGIAPDTRTNLQRRKDNITEKIESTQKRLESWNNGGGYGSWRSQAREREKMAKELEKLYELQNKLR